MTRLPSTRIEARSNNRSMLMRSSDAASAKASFARGPRLVQKSLSAGRSAASRDRRLSAHRATSERCASLPAMMRGSEPSPRNVRIHATIAASGADADRSPRQSAPKAERPKLSPARTVASAAWAFIKRSSSFNLRLIAISQDRSAQRACSAPLTTEIAEEACLSCQCLTDAGHICGPRGIENLIIKFSAQPFERRHCFYKFAGLLDTMIPYRRSKCFRTGIRGRSHTLTYGQEPGNTYQVESGRSHA